MVENPGRVEVLILVNKVVLWKFGISKCHLNLFVRIVRVLLSLVLANQKFFTCGVN